MVLSKKQELFLLITLYNAVIVQTQCFYSALSHAEYEGCFVDTPNRLFPYVWGNINFVNMTIDFCILGCADDGFKYAGLQSRQWCHCGNDPYRNPVEFPKVGDSDCNTPCYGNWSQMCGGEWRYAVYRIKDPLSTTSFKQYDTAHSGGGIITDSLSETIVSGTGLRTNINCARECSETPSCKVFSVSSSTNRCSLFKGGKLCDTPDNDANSSIYYLL